MEGRRVICIDLRCLQIGHENRGIGMHVRSVLENLAPRKNVQYIFYSFEKSDPIKKLGIQLQIPYTLVQTRSLKMSISRPRDALHLLRLVNHRFHALRGRHIDTFIQFDFMLGMPRSKKIKKVVIAYDLIPLILRSSYLPGLWHSFRTTPGTLFRLKKTLRAAYYQWRYHLHYKEFKRADQILSISEDTKQSLEKYLRVDPRKIHTIPLAPVFGKNKKPDKRILKTIPTPFLFYIGATDERKRVHDLVAAYNIARGRGMVMSLVLAGGEFKNTRKIPNQSIKEAILKSSYRDDIYTLGYVTDAEKLALYKHAFAFIFPTAYEGFGLPVLEAMQQGCPVIAYDNSSIPEVADNAASLVPTGDVNAIYHAIQNLYDNPALRSSLVDLGVVQAGKFTWDAYMTQFEKYVLQSSSIK